MIRNCANRAENGAAVLSQILRFAFMDAKCQLFQLGRVHLQDDCIYVDCIRNIAE